MGISIERGLRDHTEDELRQRCACGHEFRAHEVGEGIEFAFLEDAGEYLGESEYAPPCGPCVICSCASFKAVG